MASPMSLMVADASGREMTARDYKNSVAILSWNPGEAEAKKDGGLTLEQLNAFLMDMTQEPPWRKLANQCADYYDNKQLDAEVLQLMADRGVPPLICNMIKPTVDAVLGMEAKNRRDWMVTFGDDGQSEAVAQGINKKLNVAERESMADRAISQSYSGQVKAGVGWVEVGRHSDVTRDSPYRTNYVHRREIWWDWRKPDEEDWRYLVRKQWFDEDQLVEMLPHMKQLIMGACRGWPSYALASISENFTAEVTTLADSLERAENSFTVSEHEWRDTDRRRAVVYEVWYRKWKRGLVFRLPNGKWAEFDQNKPMHMALFQSGAIRPQMRVFPQIRQSIWIGPHRITDRKSPYPFNHFPYVPFFGFREDTTGIPYGLIRTMISPQDEINARRSRIQALLGSRTALIDNDALDLDHNTIDEAIDEVSRADSVLILNKDRRNGVSAVKIENNNDLTVTQFNMLQESKQEIHQASGLFPSMLGDDSSATSGVAINSLVEQSATTLGEINDEYASGRRRVGELFLALIVEDSKHPHETTVGEGKMKKAIYFNRPTGEVDAGGNEVLENDVAMASLKLELEDVPSTPTYRAQQFTQLAEITKALPPEAQKFVIDFVIEATDHKDRAKIARRIRSALGIPEEGQDGEDQIDPATQAMQQEYEAAMAEQGAQLQEAMQAMQKLELANADKSGQNQIKMRELDLKEKELDQKAAAEQARLDMEREQIARDADAAFMDKLSAEAGATDQDDQAEEMRQQEMVDTIAELRKAMSDLTKEGQVRIKELEKKLVDQVADAKREIRDREIAEKEKELAAKEKESKAAKPAPAPVAAPAPMPEITIGPIYIDAKGEQSAKTVTMQTPNGPITATIKPAGKPKE